MYTETWELIPPGAAEMWVVERERPELATGFALAIPADKDLDTEACCSGFPKDFSDVSF